VRLLQALHSFLPRVTLRVNKALTLDLRDPRRAHKYRRQRECRKVPVQPPFQIFRR